MSRSMAIQREGAMEEGMVWGTLPARDWRPSSSLVPVGQWDSCVVYPFWPQILFQPRPSGGGVPRKPQKVETQTRRSLALLFGVCDFETHLRFYCSEGQVEGKHLGSSGQVECPGGRELEKCQWGSSSQWGQTVLPRK